MPLPSELPLYMGQCPFLPQTADPVEKDARRNPGPIYDVVGRDRFGNETLRIENKNPVATSPKTTSPAQSRQTISTPDTSSGSAGAAYPYCDLHKVEKGEPKDMLPLI